MSIFAYERISTKEERNLQHYLRQDKAIQRYCKQNNLKLSVEPFQEDCSGKSFDRTKWKTLEDLLKPGDTIIFKDISRFTRECENGFKKYMELMDNDINLIFLDNFTLSTEYIKKMRCMADSQTNRIAKKTLNDTIELLLLVELDRVEQERLIFIQRVKDGISASQKNSGRAKGHLDKLTPELRADIEAYLNDREIKGKPLARKHHISYNTFLKYMRTIKAEKQNKQENE